MMKRSVIVSCLVALVAAAATSASPVWAQTVPAARGLVSINRPVVEIKDLFTSAGPVADTVLGPAPLPGARITVGTAQLLAIAKQYGIRWRAAGQAPSVVVERAGVPITNHEIVGPLRIALQRAGAADHLALRIGNGSLPMIPPGSTPKILVNRIAYDRATGGFRAVVLVSASRMTPVMTTISGLATPAVRAVVANHNLRPGEIINRADVKLAWVPVDTAPGGAIERSAGVIGLQVLRAVARDAVIEKGFVASPTMIARGATVELAVDMPGLEVTARGIALVAGRVGDVIAVINPSSREVVQAVVDGPDHAHVVPGSMPTRQNKNTPYYDLSGVDP